MKKLNVSIPTVIKNTKIKTKDKNHYQKAVIAMQHNNLVEAKYSMTLQQKRIMIWLVSQIQPNDMDFKEHILSIKKLMEICQLSGESTYKEIKKITFSLIEKGIRIIDISDPEQKREIQVSWLSSADYYGGQVKLSFSPKLRPYLLQLKERFTSVNSLDLMQFKSIHAIRIYELLKQFQDIGERTLSIEEIKDCCGVKEKLKTYPNFEKKILLISQREMNEKSDIEFTFERVKKSRKIVAIRFIIKKNKAYEKRRNPEKYSKEEKRKPGIEVTLRDFGFSKRVIKTIVEENTEQQIQDAINAVDIQISKGRVRNPKAMLLTAIKEHWHPERYIGKASNGYL